MIKFQLKNSKTFVKCIFIGSILVSLYLVVNKTLYRGNQPIDYVNPYMGNISHLLVPTFPTIHLPNSMLRVIPAREDYTTDHLNGLPIVTTSHRGSSAFNLSPYQGPKSKMNPVVNYSYDHESIKPYCYEVYLDDAEIQVRYGVSHQAGMYRIDFTKNEPPYLLINNRKGEIKISNGVVSGYQTISNNIRKKEQTNIFVYFETDQEPIETGLLHDGELIKSQSGEGKNQCAVLKFADNIKQVNIRYGISFISEEQAQNNLYREIEGFNMEAVLEKGEQSWNKALNKIKVKGGSEDEKTVFYTSVYRTYERPVCISEDGRYFSAFDGMVHEDNGAPFYTDDWIWDTYRATHPLRVLTEKKMETDIIKSFIRMAEQMPDFWMPTFPEITGDSRRMNSNHGVATVLDAYVKGIEDFDLGNAYLACKNAITEKTLAPWSGEPVGDLDEFYRTFGYFPALREDQKEYSPLIHSFENRQPVAVTLGTVYDEWCLSEIAKILGKEEEHKYFFARSYNYRKIYNSDTGFFHPKDDRQEFIYPFDYKFSGGMGARKYYGENNGWIYRWDVPHNPADLIQLMGGRNTFICNLDQTFNESLGRNKFSFYAQLPDHTGNVGQFSMANEPSLHIPYLYNYAGQPWKTQKRIKSLINMWFRNDLMGVPGDEDGGGMSAFVVFSQMGFYPVTPGSPTYNIGSPFFERTTIDLGDGKVFEIIANNLSEKNKYIQSATLNGEDLNKPWFYHSDIMNGGILKLEMGPKANKIWGSSEEAAPPSAKNIF
ncbi:alpha-1,2-mannosidase, putative [Mariniphaga anaerophila]|uniref:Alpha-1,2-mannosidase, putative n=1 Tax=Mariniphaga anaerophila TaxID=1484053 RepID=A0A1M5FK26_9BACT|nr:GH92 family glycosyl hydrolase [Mariniphaga anaerophila]SHF91873.1 alpha-1,2-mannosidase, putative [Mariniphaga anaerophila]